MQSLFARNKPDSGHKLSPVDSTIRRLSSTMAATESGADELNLNDKSPHHVTIPIEDWMMMKRQNEEILEAFRTKQNDKKRKRETKSRENEVSDSDVTDSVSERSGTKSRCLTLESKKQKVEEDENRLLYDNEEGEYEEDSDYEYDQEDIIEDKRKKLLEKCKGDHPVNTSGADKPDVLVLRKQYTKPEETGPKIDKDLADLFSTMALGEMGDEVIEKKMQKYKRPQNCDYFVSKVNTEMWACLEHSQKSEDIRAQKRQEIIATAVNVVAGMAQNCMTGKSTNNDTLLEGLTDAAGLMLKVMHDIALDRRRKIVSGNNIDRKYKKLASANIKVTQFLFGDDMKGACAEIDTSSKLGSGFTRSARGRKFFPAGKNWSGRGRSDQPWRDQNARGRYQYQKHQSQRGCRFSRGRGRRPQSQGRTE